MDIVIANGFISVDIVIANDHLVVIVIANGLILVDIVMAKSVILHTSCHCILEHQLKLSLRSRKTLHATQTSKHDSRSTCYYDLQVSQLGGRRCD